MTLQPGASWASAEDDTPRTDPTSKEGKSKSKRERWAREEKIIIPGGVLPPMIMAYNGRVRPGRGSLPRLQVYTACSPGYSGGGAGKGRRACNYVSGIWIPPSIPLWLPVDWAVRLPPISARSGNECECKQTLKNTWKHAPRVMTSLLMSSPSISISHRLSRCRDIQIPETWLQAILSFRAPQVYKRVRG